jgi:multidrug efflux system membrane fusion protein
VRKIATGPADTSRTVVTQGLSLGEKVVVDGADRLRDGSKVKLVAAPATNGAAGAGSSAPAGADAPTDASAQHQHRHRKSDEGADTPGAPASSSSPAPSKSP